MGRRCLKKPLELKGLARLLSATGVDIIGSTIDALVALDFLSGDDFLVPVHERRRIPHFHGVNHTVRSA
jgi:hypothetical protein